MPLTVTALTTAFFALMSVPLSLSISLYYQKTGTSQSDHAVLRDEILRRRTRAHGNFTEYVPLALALLAMLELGGTDRGVLIGFALALVVSRVLHAIGQLRGNTPMRGMAMMLSHAWHVAGALVLCWLVLA